jgi:hypothetical protein
MTTSLNNCRNGTADPDCEIQYANRRSNGLSRQDTGGTSGQTLCQRGGLHDGVPFKAVRRYLSQVPDEGAATQESSMEGSQLVWLAGRCRGPRIAGETLRRMRAKAPRTSDYVMPAEFPRFAYIRNTWHFGEDA